MRTIQCEGGTQGDFPDSEDEDEEGKTEYLSDDGLVEVKRTIHSEGGIQGLVNGLDDEEFGCAYGWLIELGTDIQDLISKSTRTVQQVYGGMILKFVYIDPGNEYIGGPCQARTCATYIHLAEKEQAEAEGRDKVRMVFIFQHKEFWPAADGKEDEQLKGTMDQRQALIKNNMCGLHFGEKLIEVYLWPGEVGRPCGKTVNGYNYFRCVEFYLYLDPSNAWSDFIFKNMEENQLEDLLFKKLRVGRLGHRDRDKIIKRCWLLRDKIYEDLDAITGGCFKSKMARQDDHSGDDFDKDLQQKVNDDRSGDDFDKDLQQKVNDGFSDSEDEEGGTQDLRDDNLVNFKRSFLSKAGTQDDRSGDDFDKDLQQKVNDDSSGDDFDKDLQQKVNDDFADTERASGIKIKKRRIE